MIELLEVPRHGWQSEYDQIIKDPYVGKKYNRQKRIREKREYINRYFPEIKKSPGNVLDLGPGPGEFLEVCRDYGCDVWGLDAAYDACEMGNEYLKLSNLMTERQQLDVCYDDIYGEDGNIPFELGFFKYINSQGAIEQIFKDYLEGTPHLVTKKSSGLSWVFDDKGRDALKHFLSEIKRVLEPNGICLIYGNGARNVEEYDQHVCSILSDLGMEIIFREGPRLHKFKKV